LININIGAVRGTFRKVKIESGKLGKSKKRRRRTHGRN
jgi:hypothetical protein